MRRMFVCELVSVSHWSNGRAPVRKTGDMRFKSQLRHKFFSQYLSYIRSTGIKNEYIIRLIYQIKSQEKSTGSRHLNWSTEKKIQIKLLFILITGQIEHHIKNISAALLRTFIRHLLDVARTIEYLPSIPPVRVRFPVKSGILISILGRGVCPLFVFCPVLSLAVALTLC